jgi:hypothetical protein
MAKNMGPKIQLQVQLMYNLHANNHMYLVYLLDKLITL